MEAIHFRMFRHTLKKKSLQLHDLPLRDTDPSESYYLRL